MSNDIEKLGYDWITADSENVDDCLTILKF